MKLNFREMTALLNVGAAMIHADGKVDENESFIIAKEVTSFGVQPNDLKTLTNDASMMRPAEAVAIISSMDDEQKHYVTSFLVTIMASDGNIDDKELALLHILTELCELPVLSLKEAINNIIVN